jgi:hypothetical protein
MANYRLTALKRCPTITASSRCRPRRHGRAQSVPGSRISSRDSQHHRAAGDFTRSSFCRSRSVFVLSPDCQRRDRRAKRRGQEETRRGQIKGTGQRTWRPEQCSRNSQECAPAKGLINSSQRTLRPAQRPLRLVRRTSQHQRCPDSHPTMTCGNGQPRTTPTINRRNQDV